MGIMYILQKKERFEHRRDEKFAEKIKSENLLSRAPEKSTQQFRCKAEGDIASEVGTSVLLVKELGKINVVYLNNKIGVVMAPDSSSLERLMGDVELSSATITEVRPTAKIFLIQLM